MDLTKAFDSVSRSGLFKILQRIGCSPKLLAIITSFHQDKQSAVCFYGATSNAFPVHSGVKQGCVLAPTMFGILFLMLVQYAFSRLYRRCLRPDEVRQQTLRHLQTPCQNQSLRGAHTGNAVCRQRCFNIPQRGGPPTSRRQAVPRLRGVCVNNQPQEDEHPGAGCCPPQQSPLTT